MKYRIIFITFISIAFFACKEETKSVASKKEVAEQPNIIVLLCDDLGYGDLSSYGHPIIQTPNIDKLGMSGIKLTNFYAAAPVCSPSRVGLLTGRSPNRAGVYDFIVGGKKKRDNNRDLVHLQANEETIPAMLKTVGYETCLVGKWHGSSLFNTPKQPKPDHFGFDHWFATHNNAVPSHENPRNFVRNGENVGELKGFSSQIIVDEAMDWLDKKEGDKPFFLEVAFHEPHVPIMSPEVLVEKYLPLAQNRKEAEFFANVENVDIAVGRLIAYLEKNNLDNTLVIFTSDNGPETYMRYEKADKSYGSPGVLKGMKLWTTEGGFRVPCIVNWIGKKTFMGTSDKVVSALDFLPTFAALTGASLPDRTLDGTSFAPLLNGDDFTRQKPLLWGFYNALNERVVAMRSGDWKIMCQLKTDTEFLPKITNVYDGNEALVKNAQLADFVLYNVLNDPAEKEDLSTTNTDVFEELKKELQTEYTNLLADSHIWVRD